MGANILRLRPCRRPPRWNIARLGAGKLKECRTTILIGGWWQSPSFSCLWSHFGSALEAVGLALGVLWTSLVGSGAPLWSHWVPLDDIGELIGHLWCSQAPLWEVLEAHWVHFEVTWCHFGWLGHQKCRLRMIRLTLQKPTKTFCFY